MRNSRLIIASTLVCGVVCGLLPANASLVRAYAAEPTPKNIVVEAPVASSQSKTDRRTPLTRPNLQRIIRTATLELRVENLGEAAQEIESIATAAGGFVSESGVVVERPGAGDEASESRVRAGTATVTIRVPAGAYAGVMDQLRGMAIEVLVETSETSDVAKEFADLEVRLRNLQATEQRYLELLQRPEAISHILTVQDRLDDVQIEIEQMQSRINALNDQSQLATITVRLRLPVDSWVEDAWDASWPVAAAVLAVAAAAAILGGLSLRWRRRKRPSPTSASEFTTEFRVRYARFWLGGLVLIVLAASVCTTGSFVLGGSANHIKQHPTYPYRERTPQDLGRDHLPRGQTFDRYNSNPPTSGPHAEPVPWGVYEGPVPKERVVANMERGGVVTWHNCDKPLPLDPGECMAQRAEIASIVQAAVDEGMFVLTTPYSDMPHRIALTAWRTIDFFDDFDQARVLAFISSYECRFDFENAC